MNPSEPNLPSVRRPNVLLILTDDLGWGDLSCHGNPHLETPELDLLHANSSRLNRYCSGPVCTPARAALFTGRHPYRTGAIDTYLGRSMLKSNEVTLADLFQRAGYRTGLFGKWHLGDCYPLRPHDRGFEECLVHRGGGLRQPANIGRDSYFSPDLVRNGRQVSSEGYCTDIFTDAAIAFIEATSERAEPFFCCVSYNAPHTPLEVPEEWVEPFRKQGLGEKTARVYAMVTNIDANVGRLVEVLRRRGRLADTTIVFTSDHGPCYSSCDEPRVVRFNGELRAAKSTLFEGGIRVPCFWKLPDRLRPAGDVDRVTNPIDVLPTLCELSGIPLPADLQIDGRSLAPLLSGTAGTADWPDRWIPMQWHRGDVPERYRNAAVIGQRFKWYRPEAGAADLLFDVEADPSETTNLASGRPDTVAQMKRFYEKWFSEVSASSPENYAPPRIGLGYPQEPMTWLTRQDWRLYAPDDEGWSGEHPGYWEVEVAESADYRVWVEFEEMPRDGDVLHLAGGTTAKARPLRKGSPRSLELERVALEAGPARFEAYVQRGDRRLGPLFVTVQPSAPAVGRPG